MASTALADGAAGVDFRLRRTRLPTGMSRPAAVARSFRLRSSSTSRDGRRYRALGPTAGQRHSMVIQTGAVVSGATAEPKSVARAVFDHGANRPRIVEPRRRTVSGVPLTPDQTG